MIASHISVFLFGLWAGMFLGAYLQRRGDRRRGGL